MSNIPEGWTDDLTIQVAPGRTLEELVDFVLQAKTQGAAFESTIAQLMQEFGLSQYDASLAWDRALGGAFRAATGSPENCPDKEKDPVAWISYNRCFKKPDLIAAIYPEFKKKPWWKLW